MITYCLLCTLVVVVVVHAVVPPLYALSVVGFSWITRGRVKGDPWKVYKWLTQYKEVESRWSSSSKFEVKYLGFIKDSVSGGQEWVYFILLYSLIISSCIGAILLNILTNVLEKYTIQDLASADMYLVITLLVTLSPFLIRFLLDLCFNLKHDHSTGESKTLTKLTREVEELKQKLEEK